MSICLLVQSPAESATAQSLIVPTNNSVDVYHRISTGQRGRGDTWTKVDVNDLPATTTTMNPVAIRLSDADKSDIRIGRMTNLGTKTIKASTMQTPSMGGEHIEVVRNLVERLSNGDNTLIEYVTDGRVSNMSLNLRPIRTSVPTGIGVSNLVVTTVSERKASVPDSSWGRNYIQRKIAGRQDFDVMDWAMAERKNLLLVGHAGSGKTMSALAFASKRGLPYYSLSCSMGLNTKKVFGGFNPAGEGKSLVWQDGAVTEMVRHGGVLVFEEINMAIPKFLSEIHGLTDGRRQIELTDKDGEVIQAHPDLLILATMNPEYRGTQPLNEALNDRFYKLQFPYDMSIEKKLVRNSAVLDMANKLRARFEVDEIRTPISTRSLVAFMDALESFDLDFAAHTFVNNFPAGEQGIIQQTLDTFKANIERGQKPTTFTTADFAERI